MVRVTRRTETPHDRSGVRALQGARDHTGQYSTETQRSQAECSADRMQRDFHHGLLELADVSHGAIDLRGLRQR